MQKFFVIYFPLIKVTLLILNNFNFSYQAIMTNKDINLFDLQVENAINLQRNGEFEQARLIYEKLLNKSINKFKILFLLGTLEAQCHNFSKAINFLLKASKLSPNSWEINYNLGNAYTEINEFNSAIKFYNQAIKVNSNNSKLFYYRGTAYNRLEQYAKAVKDLEKALNLDSNNTPANLQLAIALVKLSEYKKAIKNFEILINIEPENPEFHFQYGLSLFADKNYLGAVVCLENAIKFKKEFPEAYLVLGDAQHALNKRQEAINSYKNSIHLNNKNEIAHYNLAIVLMESKIYHESLLELDEVLQLNPNFHLAYNALSNVYLFVGQLDFALEKVSKAIELNPNDADYYMNRGNVLSGLRKFNECLNEYRKSLEIKPNNAQAYSNIGYVLLNFLGNAQAALPVLDAAITLKPNLSAALINRAECLVRLHQYESALVDFLKALELDGDSDYILGKCLHYKMKICDWSNLDEGFLICETMLNDKKLAAVPFETLNFFDKPDIHLFAAELYNNQKARPNNSLGKIDKRSFKSTIKVAYVSADLYNHPASIWLAEQLENHDRSKVELYAFCSKSINDPMRDRLEAAFDHWIDVTNLSDLQVAKLSRVLEIDIAIDANGHTGDGRPGIFAARAAPIQVNYLGYPGSMGAEYIDYMFGLAPNPDEDLEELARSRQFISEKIAYLPSGFTYDRQRQLSDEPLTRAQFGLPETGFVFTCQNGCQKLLPEVFDIWMQILRAVPGSVLWLLRPNETAVKNLIKEANARGVEAERLIFTAREVVPIDQERARVGKYLASYKLADLFLDTWPYNAGTTAIDALWAGLPVLTKMGKAYVARMATDALRTIEVPELITRTPQDYKELAIQLAHNPERLKQLKDKVQRNRVTKALFDPVGNTRHIENAYLEMYRRYQEGLAPEDFFVHS
jgi:predicted O-linked N-acetylglucosamine transferase (SPINDLY family)